MYVISLMIQLLHCTEEYLGGFYTRIVEVSPFPPMSSQYFLELNAVAYACFLIGAVGIWKNQNWAMVIAWFFIIAGVFGNALGHTLMALRVGGYFPGLYTSFLYWMALPFWISMLLRLKQPVSS